MIEQGEVNKSIENGIGTIEFFHPKSNSLPSVMLKEIAASIKEFGNDKNVKVIVIKSKGEKAFCAGAFFDELIDIADLESGKEFFMGFARVINEMRKAPQFIITRIQGKTVGGGVGIAAASDYAIALKSASIKLSELALGIGPFVVGPAVERKIGKGPFTALSTDYEWRTAAWAERYGLFTELHDNINELDNSVNQLAVKLSKLSFEAMEKLKRVHWEGTEDWDNLLEKRAEISGELVLSDFTKKYLKEFLNSRKD